MSATIERPPAPPPAAPPFEEPDNPLHRLTPEQIEQLGRELDALHAEVFADLGERDARYIRSTIRFHRQLVIGARLLLLRSDKRPLWLAGTAALSLAKILENMEIGHNVMHGQWDWMNDPDINSRSWDWDTASPAEAWRHSHNYEHHTFTNIRGKDRDLGYEIMRIDPHQRWHPVYLAQPLYNLLLMGFFEWGVALHDLNFEAIRKGEKPKAKALAELRAIGLKARRQVVKDYIAFPLLSAAASAGQRRQAQSARGGGCAHLQGHAHRQLHLQHRAQRVGSLDHLLRALPRPDVHVSASRRPRSETRGAWYVRQLLGSANIDGRAAVSLRQRQPRLPGRAPPVPRPALQPLRRDRPARARHLPPLRPAVQHGPLPRQLGAVHRTILRLAFPGGRPRPKGEGYRAEAGPDSPA